MISIPFARRVKKRIFLPYSILIKPQSPDAGFTNLHLKNRISYFDHLYIWHTEETVKISLNRIPRSLPHSFFKLISIWILYQSSPCQGYPEVSTSLLPMNNFNSSSILASFHHGCTYSQSDLFLSDMICSPLFRMLQWLPFSLKITKSLKYLASP